MKRHLPLIFSSLLWFTAVTSHSQELVIPGATPEQRIENLKKLLDGATPESESKYLKLALMDKSAEVRAFGACCIADVEQLHELIRLLTKDPSPKVRSAIAMTMSSATTDGGLQRCENSSIIEENLPAFLRALEDHATSPWILEIFGARFSYDTVLPCCFSQTSREKVLDALRRTRESDAATSAISAVEACAISNKSLERTRAR